MGGSLALALARCLREQAEARAYLDGEGPDKDGAWRGLCDWLMEEALIRLELVLPETIIDPRKVLT